MRRRDDSGLWAPGFAKGHRAGERFGEQKGRGVRDRPDVSSSTAECDLRCRRQHRHRCGGQLAGSEGGGEAKSGFVFGWKAFCTFGDDITEISLDSGYLESTGRTPHNTMRARLSVDVRDNPDSPFSQSAPGVYGLKKWG